MVLFTSFGTLHYSFEPFKLIVSVDEELARFYRHLIPKYYKCQQQRWSPHITVLRHTVPPNMAYWKKYENSSIEFRYDPYVQSDQRYWWLNVECPRLTEIRRELGLQPWDTLNKPPNGEEWFHITLGNAK